MEQVISLRGFQALKESQAEIENALKAAHEALEKLRSVNLAGLTLTQIGKIVGNFQAARLSVALFQPDVQTAVERQTIQKGSQLSSDEILRIVEDLEPEAFAVRLA